MLEAARERLQALPGMERVELRSGALEELPIGDSELDLAVCSLVLHYVPHPEAALAEAARALRPGGRLLVLDMLAHNREEYRERMGHVWQGFAPAQLECWLSDAGFTAVRYTPLPADPRAKGPRLFVCTAVKS